MKQLQRAAGIAIALDGLGGLMFPQKYLRALEAGPKPINRLLETFAERPHLTRFLSTAEIALGVFLIAR